MPRILTLNMNMFNLDVDRDFFNYLEETNPDIAFIQEFKYNQLKDVSEYEYCFPKSYDKEEKIDSRVHISAAYYKKDKTLSKNVDSDIDDYRIVEVKNGQKENGQELSIAGIHAPLFSKVGDDITKVFSKLNDDIICGDFNVDLNKSNKDSANYIFLQKFLDDGYENLWTKGLKEEKAYYINYKGEKLCAKNNIRTFVGNTHIDYILAKQDIKINEIVIDLRTLAFTDHVAVYADVDVKK